MPTPKNFKAEAKKLPALVSDSLDGIPLPLPRHSHTHTHLPDSDGTKRAQVRAMDKKINK